MGRRGAGDGVGGRPGNRKGWGEEGGGVAGMGGREEARPGGRRCNRKGWGGEGGGRGLIITHAHVSRPSPPSTSS